MSLDVVRTLLSGATHPLLPSTMSPNSSAASISSSSASSSSIVTHPLAHHRLHHPVASMNDQLTQPWTIVFSYLPLADYLSALRVCHLWCLISEKNTSWSSLNLDRLHGQLAACQSRGIFSVGASMKDFPTIGRMVRMPSIQDETWFQSQLTSFRAVLSHWWTKFVGSSSRFPVAKSASSTSTIDFSQQPSLHGLMTSSRWNHMRYLVFDLPSRPPPPSPTYSFTQHRKITAWWEMEHGLISNAMRWFIIATQQNGRLNKLEGVQLLYSYERDIDYEADMDYAFGHRLDLQPKLIEQFYSALITLPQLRVLISRKVHPLVSELIHLKVLILFELPSATSLALLHQLEYLSLHHLNHDGLCDAIRELSSSHALRALHVDCLTERDVDQLCLPQSNKPVCGLTQLQFSDTSDTYFVAQLDVYAPAMRKILLGLPHLTSLHEVRWIGLRNQLVVAVDENDAVISTEENLALVEALGSLLTLSIRCHSYYSKPPATDLRFTSSLTHLYWHCAESHQDYHQHPPGTALWTDLTQLKRLTLHMKFNSDERGMCIKLKELSVLQQLVQLEIFTETGMSCWIPHSELFEILSNLPHFESCVFNRLPAEEPLTFSSDMLRSITHSRTWLNITILNHVPSYMEVPSYINPQRHSVQTTTRPLWIRTQPNLDTEIGSHQRWKHFRVKANSYEYQLTAEEKQSSEQNYSWIRTIDLHPFPTTTNSTITNSSQSSFTMTHTTCFTIILIAIMVYYLLR